MAWLGIIFFFLHGYARACNSSCLDPFNSYLLIPEERRKTFGLSWNRTQVLLLCKWPLWPLDHGSSGRNVQDDSHQLRHRLHWLVSTRVSVEIDSLVRSIDVDSSAVVDVGVDDGVVVAVAVAVTSSPFDIFPPSILPFLSALLLILSLLLHSCRLIRLQQRSKQVCWPPFSVLLFEMSSQILVVELFEHLRFRVWKKISDILGSVTFSPGCPSSWTSRFELSRQLN